MPKLSVSILCWYWSFGAGFRSVCAVISRVQIVDYWSFGAGFRSVRAVVSFVQIVGHRAVLVFWRWFWSFCIRGGFVSFVPLVDA